MKLTEVLLNRKRSEGPSVEGFDSWSEAVQAVPIHLVSAGKYQPRQGFDEGALAELAESIKTHGLLQPVVVRRGTVGYELIVGERRLRACKRLGWEVVPAIIREVEDREAAELALIENLQRSDLHVFEIAEGYERLLTEFSLTQEELGTRLGVSQANVANKIRLLKLPPEIRKIISREMLSERHSRALLRLASAEQQMKVLQTIVRDDLSVKQTEELVTSLIHPGRPKVKGDKPVPKRKLIIKDLRLFTNSVKQLTDTLESSGLVVKVDEREDEEVYELVVTVKKKPIGGGTNG
ncbi:MAG: ParB/RepB/Spo0J family partition protein [Limnochordia bacterium]|nr:ParB/RepB/Spo0J family partition protein [Limnochordia bacterium]